MELLESAHEPGLGLEPALAGKRHRREAAFGKVLGKSRETGIEVLMFKGGLVNGGVNTCEYGSMGRQRPGGRTRMLA